MPANEVSALNPSQESGIIDQKKELLKGIRGEFDNLRAQYEQHVAEPLSTFANSADQEVDSLKRDIGDIRTKPVEERVVNWYCDSLPRVARSTWVEVDTEITRLAQLAQNWEAQNPPNHTSFEELLASFTDDKLTGKERLKALELALTLINELKIAKPLQAKPFIAGVEASLAPNEDQVFLPGLDGTQLDKVTALIRSTTIVGKLSSITSKQKAKSALNEVKGKLNTIPEAWHNITSDSNYYGEQWKNMIIQYFLQNNGGIKFVNTEIALINDKINQNSVKLAEYKVLTRLGKVALATPDNKRNAKIAEENMHRMRAEQERKEEEFRNMVISKSSTN